MNDQQLSRYSRHILLPQLDIVGQQRIIDSKVLVVGCGGLGCAAIPLLVAAGVGEIIIADDDHIDLSNLQRQLQYTEQDVDQLKTDVMACAMARLNTDSIITTVTQRLQVKDLLKLLVDCDVVLDCSDNFPTRQAINLASVITKTPLIFGAAIRFEGQLTVFDPRQEDSPCYACLFSGEDMAKDSCSLSGVFSPLVTIIGAQQAAEAIKIITNMGKTPIGTLVQYDAFELNHYNVQFKRNPHCDVCSKAIYNSNLCSIA